MGPGRGQPQRHIGASPGAACNRRDGAAVWFQGLTDEIHQLHRSQPLAFRSSLFGFRQQPRLGVEAHFTEPAAGLGCLLISRHGPFHLRKQISVGGGAGVFFRRIIQLANLPPWRREERFLLVSQALQQPHGLGVFRGDAAEGVGHKGEPRPLPLVLGDQP